MCSQIMRCGIEEGMKIDSTVIKALCYHIIDIIEFYELMERTHNCNDCGNINYCGIAPDFGERVRYNCYLWKEKSEVKELIGDCNICRFAGCSECDDCINGSQWVRMTKEDEVEE